MLTLIVIGLAGGVVTSISPCVLPVLPVVLTSGARGEATHGRNWRSVLVVVGLVVSFSVATLVGSITLSALGLPQDLLRDVGIAVLLIIGLSLLLPAVGRVLERPFARVPGRSVAGNGNGFVLGLGLGLLYVPCAGPVLASIAVLGATHRIGWDAVVLTAAFGIGAGVPLLIVALAGDTLMARVGALRRNARGLRIGAGAILIVVAVLITFNLTDALQRHVPGYTSSLQNNLGGTSAQLKRLTESHGSATQRAPSPGQLGGRCTEAGRELENCGKAPAFNGIDAWLNTPGDQPLTLRQLRGRVVLVDFWTYSCINCQRTLPHVEAWYRNYEKDGLVVVGVHTPEFAFEHVRSNVVAQSKALGVKYPVAMDNEYGTWNAYRNEYWPADYLIDPFGNIRHVSFGEGDYDGTESLIRQLLEQAHPGVTLPRATDVPTTIPDPEQSPETYLGTHYAPLMSEPAGLVKPGTTRSYAFPKHFAYNGFALSGTWTSTPEYLRAGPDARLELRYMARHVYLVLGGTGTVVVTIPGRPTRTISVSGVPKLYSLAYANNIGSTVLTLSATPGVQAYDFTFG